MKKSNTEDFIRKAKEIHGDKYDYSKVVYVNSQTKVCIICPEHGEFWQTPNNHLAGRECPKCKNEKIGLKNSSNIEEFLRKAHKIHGDRYDYSKSVYVLNITPICIICPEHGEFWQKPTEHLSGCGCPKCKGKNMTREEFIEKALEIHGNKYDYSKTNFRIKREKVIITCPEHGDFEQLPNSHLKGHGCPVCARINAIMNTTRTKEEFIEHARKIHGDRYDYSLVKYVSSKDEVEIICLIHGVFKQKPNKHLQGHGCRKCYSSISKPEGEICEFIKGCGVTDIIENSRKLISPKEIDLYVPDKHIAFEYNGLIWHSECFNKDMYYHLNKSEKLLKQGVNLIHIFEDDFLFKKNVVFKEIKRVLGLQRSNDVENDKLKFSVITENKTSEFVNTNSLYDYIKSVNNYGCFYEDELIGVISLKNRKDTWTITNFCVNEDFDYYRVFSFFIDTLKHKCYFNKLIFKINRCWFTNNEDYFLKNNGFVYTKTYKPKFKYFIQKEYGMRRIEEKKLKIDSIITKYNLDKNINKEDMLSKIKAYRVWDCGYNVYEWKRVKTDSYCHRI